MSWTVDEKLRFIRRVFGSIDISRDGINVAVKCPSCAQTGSLKKKLVLRIDTDQYHCWVCGTKGRSYVSLLRKHHSSFVDEYQKKFAKATVSSRLSFDNTNDVEVEKIKIPKNFSLLGNLIADKDPDVRAVISYITSRGLTIKDAWRYKMGTCRRGKFRRRVIIPSFDCSGELNYYVARAIDKDATRRYINSSVPKSEVIFNELTLKWNEEMTLVEGPFDLVKCDRNATCLLGSNLSSKMALFKKIVKNQTPIILALDPDAIKKSHEIAKMLSSYGVDVKMMNVPNGRDVGDMSHSEFLTRKDSARLWNSSDRLYHMIGEIRSGSVI
jgi:hypothetical protein